MKRGLLAWAAALALALPAAAATPSSPDYSDLWWNPAESGWGAEIQQQGDTLFMTLYVYGADNAATWFVASGLRPRVTVAPGPPTWDGRLYRARGPVFSAAFNPDAVSAVDVGTASLEFTTADSATLRYTVDGAQVVKSLSRQTWREVSLAGRYHGGLSTALVACSDPNLGGAMDVLGPLTVTHAGAGVVMSVTTATLAGLPSSCTFRGDYRQRGRLGSVAGTFSCTLVIGLDERGENVQRVTHQGAFTLERIEASANGYFGRLRATGQDCTYDGTLGGVRLP
jgi:hypothetical protein